jgi:hypothetical protein
MSFSFKRMIIVAAQGKQFGEAFPHRSHLKRKGWSNALRRQAPELPNDRNRLSARSASTHGWETPHHHCHFFHHPARGALQIIRQPIGIDGRGIWTTLIAERPGMRLKPSGRIRGHGGRDPQKRESHED